MPRDFKGTVLILGGSGRFGRHATVAFRYRGWDVRQFDRDTQSLWDAAWGADVIVNAWNPPYTEWAETVPRLTEQVIEVAKASGATVIIPGNVYVFGQSPETAWTADSPHAATNPLGRIRQEMEAAYRDAGVKTIVLRAGDFIDTEASGNWFDMILTAKLNRCRFVYPGAWDRLHAWAWLPDVAEAAAMLAERRDQLAQFEDIPFEGYTLTGAALADAVEQVMHRPIRRSRMSWVPLVVASPFWPMGRKLREMRYLWDMPHALDGQRLRQLLPGFRATDLHEALSVALHDHIHPNETVTRGGLAFQR